MSFLQTLREARASRVSILHEFKIQYYASANRFHGFFEGHDDIAFIAPLVERFLPPGFRLFSYRCENKAGVMEAFNSVVGGDPGVRRVLFFVDKDLDDILGVPWPTDPRIFVTDVYSIENYVVDAAVFRRFLRASTRVAGISFSEEVIVQQFEAQLIRFQRRSLGLMAWVLVCRREGQKVNLNNVSLASLFRFSDACEVSPARGSRLQVLADATGTVTPPTSRRLRAAHRELSRMPIKRVLRGKFEAWFMVEFWKRLMTQLRQLAAESGGKVSPRVTLEHGCFIPVLGPYADVPPALERFLIAHLHESATPATTKEPLSRPSVLKRLVRLISRR